MSAARLVIAASRSKAGWWLGTASLAYAKSIENMELGHNISHGQWDWMNDPEIHSTTWEWDMVGLSAQWRYSHNYRHHVFSNVLGMDEDIGYRLLRVTPRPTVAPCLPVDATAKPVAGGDLRMGYRAARPALGAGSRRHAGGKAAEQRRFFGKIARQLAKDYLFLPAVSLRRWRRTLAANVTANLLRNLWVYVNHLRAHPRRRRDVRPGGARGRDQRRVVSAADARGRKLQSRSAAGILRWPPVLPDRAPPVPRPAEQPPRTGQHPRPGTVREVRSALQHRIASGQYFRTQRTIVKLAVPDGILTAGRRHRE